MEKNLKLSKIQQALFQPYRERVPDVGRIVNQMIVKGIIPTEQAIENDHIAFRTLGVPHLGIRSFEKIFLHYGYTRKDAYFFEKKRLNAFWYAPPSPEFPRVFISELRVEDFPQDIQEILHKYTHSISSDPVDDIDLDSVDDVSRFFHQPLWELPTLEDYQTLAEASEYASWVIYNRYYLNHYTISVHALPKGYNTLEEFNDFLESIGVVLNTAGGKIKVSPDGLLRQSSSVAHEVEARFAGDARMKIPGSYVEFAERLVLPEFQGLASQQLQRHHRREGFEAGNADKIFESTFQEQVKQQS
ncbi:MAG: DUF1338 domain-containing protein [Flavobacteriaceae bacterium]